MDSARKIKISLQPERIPRPTLNSLWRGNVVQLDGLQVAHKAPGKPRGTLAGWWRVARLKQTHDSQPLQVWLERAAPR